MGGWGVVVVELVWPSESGGRGVGKVAGSPLPGPTPKHEVDCPTLSLLFLCGWLLVGCGSRRGMGMDESSDSKKC